MPDPEMTTVIQCNTCKARVQAKVLAEREYSVSEGEGPYKYIFAECAHCKTSLIGLSEYVDFGEDDSGWTYPERRWPEPDDSLDNNIPRSVRKSLQEASRCFSNHAFMATAVMCGRAIEAICQEKTKAKTLADGLKKLRSNKVIRREAVRVG